MEFIDKLTDELSPIQDVAIRLIGADPKYILRNGVMSISKRPKIGTEAYALILYEGIADENISKYEQIHELKINPQYRKILLALSGAFLFQISLFGIPPTMNQFPARLDRSSLQPHDLATANRIWKINFKDVDHLFHFGGGPWSDHENVGYFIDADGNISAILKDGTVIKSWNKFGQFLASELERAEKSYPEYENLIFKLKNENQK